jgi:hypothetical protein
MGKVLGEQLKNLQNPMGTWWEQIENKGEKKTKKISKRKKLGPSWVHAEPSHWLHKIYIFKTVLGDIVCPPKIPPKLSNILCIYLTFFIWMQQKMQVFNVNYGNKQLWKEKLKAANGKAWHALMNGPVSFFLKWGRGVFCFFPFVPNVFLSCSHGVLIKFPKCCQ